MASQSPLPETHRALVLHSNDTPPKVETRPVPQATPGNVVVRVLAANVLSYSREMLDGTRPYPYPKPYVPGGSAVGRIAAVGPDCSTFAPGQLVLVDIMTRARDDTSASYLMGIHQGFSTTTVKLATDEWRDSTYAEYAKVPLENVYALDEERLLGDSAKGGLGYTVEDLAYLYRLLVPFGGFRDIDLKVGETVLIGPATGPYGTAAVSLALALGAKVVAMGRNGQVLEKLAATSDRVKTVQLTGDVKADTAAIKRHGPIDVFYDICPPAAASSTHIMSGILSLAHSGRVSLMGGIAGDVAIPYAAIMFNDLKLHGKFMYEREDARLLVKMVETGVLGLGGRIGAMCEGRFGLEEWSEAFDAAKGNAGPGQFVVIKP
ncbi:GroES-like protein [Trichoderma citrinoviride]|uniref:GroES-like protein n=1 Tax=Trichoderma citrinoviride TaxID=58853 RepID=A0A2T4B9L0_9HYPO|nr:GroES-like protein [Trichoderma citrinoviride]PTB66016.1 GroES-like protein [Trichoderma citrinoviride]